MSRQERYSPDFILQAAVFLDIGDTGDLDADPFATELNYCKREQQAHILEWLNRTVYDTEEFKAASRIEEHRDPKKEVKIRREPYEYTFFLPLPVVRLDPLASPKFSLKRHFTRTNLSDPSQSLDVLITPSMTEIIEKRDGKKIHLSNCEAANWVAIMAIWEFNSIPSASLHSFPASV